MNDVTITVDGGAGPLECHVRGDGPAVVLLPSLGRGAHDFDDLSTRLAEAGFRTIRPEPRGIGGSALLPEQPETVATTVLSWLRERMSGTNQA